ncbi:hypothetical protein N2152v2_010032 [Parachlorella kessleri]
MTSWVSGGAGAASPTSKLQTARATGHEEQLLAFLTKASQQWKEAAVEVLSPTDLPPLLDSLAAHDSGGLHSLELRFGSEQDDPSITSYRWTPRYPGQRFQLPQELERMTSLSALSIHQLCTRRCVFLTTYAPGNHLPGPHLARLSALTALQSLALECVVEGPLPPEAFSSLAQLTSLDVTIPTFPPRGVHLDDWEGQRRRLGSEHLAPLTALRRLRLAGVEPHLPAPMAVLAWQRLEDLQLLHLPDLVHSLPARLSDLQLLGFSQPALAPLPPTVTALAIGTDPNNSLQQELACVGTLRYLGLSGNSLSRVPAVLGGGAASRLEHLDMRYNCRAIVNYEDEAVDDAGLQVLRSLTALTHLSLERLPEGFDPGTKLQRARAAGHEGQLLGFLTRAAQMWQEAAVEVLSPTDVPLLLGCLGAHGGGNICSLQLRFGSEQDDPSVPSYLWRPRHPGHCFPLSQELERMTSLTALSFQQLCIRRYIQDSYCGVSDHLPASCLARLSSLSALQSLALECVVEGPLPPEAFSSLAQLTSLDVTIPTFPPRGANVDEWWVGQRRRLGSEHLAPLTALRRLRLAGVEPYLPSLHAVLAWQRLEELQLVQVPPRARCEPGWGCEAGMGAIWTALPWLPCLTRLEAEGIEGFPSVSLSFALPAWLSALRLRGLSQPALAPLPPSLTALDIGTDPNNSLQQAWRTTTWTECQWCWGGGAASRLEHLDMRYNFHAVVNEEGQVDDAGLGVLRSLTAMTSLRLERLPRDFDPGSEVLRKALVAGGHTKLGLPA